MYIKNLKLQNFRNYENEKIEFDKNINVLYGDNAQGKTNILEAIFFSSFGKSFRTLKEKEIIKKDEEFSKIEVNYVKKDREGNIKFLISKDNKKSIFINDIKIKKLSELLGNVNIVLFEPSDINIFKEGPKYRRKFLDMMIGQLRSNYVYNLNQYLKVLEQRNNYLKQNNYNEEMLDIWDESLVKYGKVIFNYRNEFIDKIKEKIVDIHKKIANEEITMKYISDCEDENLFLKKLKENREEDRKRGYTTVGIQRDDFKLFVNHEMVSVFGSQGQNRTCVLSLKLAELQVIYDDIGEYPILLLDDFMSELDQKRINNFLKNIEDIQVIITCTKNIDLKNSKSFYIEKGKIKLDKD